MFNQRMLPVSPEENDPAAQYVVVPELGPKLYYTRSGENPVPMLQGAWHLTGCAKG
jgi:hypothetical protein